MSKYKIPVNITSTAGKTIGMIECDSIKEFREKSEKLWESVGYDSPSTNVLNDFDLGDWELVDIEEEDMEYYFLEGE